MSLDSMRNAISQTVRQQGQRLMRITPSAITVGLVSAALLPAMLGDLSTVSPALAATLGLLSQLGADVLQDFIADFLRRLRERQEKGQTPSEAEIREQAEKELLQQWEAGGEEAAALRADASRLLQAVQGVETALAAATDDVKQALAQGLADLGGSFREFRWILDELRQTLAEIRTRQALQLGLQREQLDLQRQQLVKTNLLLQIQQERAVAPMPVGPPEAEEEEIPPADVPCPYKGLAAFEPEDAEYFFGREELVAELTARLAGTRFLAVVGPSGSGKSSLVRAGLLPAIWQDALPGSKDWQTLILTPGQYPLEELAIRVSLLRGIAPSSLLKDLTTDRHALDLAVKQALADEPDHVYVMLVVDQFEEVFALCRDEGERQQFIDALLYAVEAANSRTVVVPTIRADFYGHCADYPNLAARLQDNVLVGPLREAQLRQVIERPAALVGLRLEPGLVEAIMRDVADEPGALPLLSHALLETWERRRGRTLTLAGYAESGGVAGAIAQTADMVFGGLSAEEQTIARSIFLRLTELGEEGTQDTRRRAAPTELIRRPEDALIVEGVLKTLADARLITTGEETIEVAHEALIREWPALRGWLEEDREGLRIHRHLTEAAQEWERLERDPGELYRGARLATASEWAEEHADDPNPLEREFLEASQEAARREEAEREAQRQRELEAERQRVRRLRWGVAGLALVLLAVISLASFAFHQRAAAQQQARVALANQLAAQSLSLLDSELDLALLLSVQAYDTLDTVDSRSTLLTALEYSPGLIRLLRGHTGAVYGVAFSPDGTTMASGSEDNTIRLWDVETGEPIGQPITGHTGEVASVAFSPDGAILASCGRDPVAMSSGESADTTVRLWDAGTGEPIGQPLAGHTGWVNSVAFSPDGATLASAGCGKPGDWSILSEQWCFQGEMILWDVEAGVAIGGPITGHVSEMNSVAFSPDGAILASGSCGGFSAAGQCIQGEILLWDVETRELIGRPITGHGDAVRSVAFSPDGATLASGSDDTTIRLWHVETGEPIGQPLSGHAVSVESVAFSPDGLTLASGGGDKTIRLWDVATGRAIGQPIAGHAADVTSVAFSPDGATLVSGGGSPDNSVRLWDPAVGGSVSSLFYSHPSGLNNVALSPDGAILASSTCGERPVGDPVFSREAINCIQGAILLWDIGAGGDMASAGEIDHTLTAHNHKVITIAFSPDGATLASGSMDKTIILWDVATRQPIGQPLTGHTDCVYSLAFSPDGNTLASTGPDTTIRLWDVETRQPIGQPLTGHTWVVFGLNFSPDGATLFSSSWDGTIRLWDVQTRQPIGEPLTGHTAGVATLGLSPDGRILASGGGFMDPVIILWDVETRQPIGSPLAGHTNGMYRLRFSPDGATLASSNMDSTIRLWDVATGQLIGQPLTGHTDYVSGLAFSLDGRTLASSSWDGTLRLWDVDPESWKARACEIAGRNFTRDEWEQYLPGYPYGKTCEQWPEGE